MRELFTILSYIVLLLSRSVCAQSLVYIGSGAVGQGSGIYVATLDDVSGTLSQPKLAAAIDNPSFLALHPSGRWLYSVTSTVSTDGNSLDEVVAFVVLPDGGLRLLNRQLAGGASPCHLSVDASGHVLFLANYRGANVATFTIRADGTLSPATSTVQHYGASRVDVRRQSQPHPHGIYPSPAGNYVYVPDLGLDKIVIYHRNTASGALTPNDPPQTLAELGGGPRHLVFHPNGNFAYVNLELSSRILAYRVDRISGALLPIQGISSLPPDSPAKGNSAAEILFHPGGKFLYVSNRGHDSVSVFAVDSDGGSMRFIAATSTGGRTPRSVGITRDGRFMLAANQDSETVAVFRVDSLHGTLSPVAAPVLIDRPLFVMAVTRNNVLTTNN